MIFQVQFMTNQDVAALIVQSNSKKTSNRTADELYLFRGYNMSVLALLNLFNELGKRDKMRVLSSILSLFQNEFNKFNNTGARMVDSKYHMKLRYL